MIKVGRFINGICLNGYEYLMNESGTVELTFADKSSAINYLKGHNLEFKDEEELENEFGIYLLEVDKNGALIL